MKTTASSHKVSNILKKIHQRHINDKKIPIKVIVKELHSISFYGVVFIIGLFFSFPIPLPAVSTPFGLILCSLGIGMMCKMQLWIPKWILKKEIKRDTLQKITYYSEKVFEKLEKIVHSRAHYFCKSNIFKIITGIVLVIQGFLLALPLPIPFTNVMAAFPVLIISIGLLEDDGYILLLGYFFSFISMISFLILFLGIKKFFMAL
jgi:hypothetical protein